MNTIAVVGVLGIALIVGGSITYGRLGARWRNWADEIEAGIHRVDR